MSEVVSSKLINTFIYTLPYLMGFVFILAIIVRSLIYYTVRRHEWFSREFEKRVNCFVDSQDPGQTSGVSFYVLSKKFLEKTYYEIFELRDRAQRRQSDPMMKITDRIFLVKQGCAWLVKDIIKQLKFLKWTQETPKMLNITKSTFNHNPCFNRIFGIFPIGVMNDLVSLLPGLFVVAGILGTFLGIRGGLTALGSMSVENLDATRKVMDSFLREIAFAMGSSIVGIAFSLMLHVFNTIVSPDRMFSSMIDRFESSLDCLWYRSDNNDFPANNSPFNEHRDPTEALAEEAVKLETSKLKTA
jgi:hypothetical protein